MDIKKIIKKRKSLIKTITFRVLATITTFLTALFITGDLKSATSIGILEIITKSLIYYIHERIWE